VGAASAFLTFVSRGIIILSGRSPAGLATFLYDIAEGTRLAIRQSLMLNGLASLGIKAMAACAEGTATIHTKLGLLFIASRPALDLPRYSLTKVVPALFDGHVGNLGLKLAEHGARKFLVASHEGEVGIKGAPKFLNGTLALIFLARCATGFTGDFWHCSRNLLDVGT
jgi:hypothetical protein